MKDVIDLTEFKKYYKSQKETKENLIEYVKLNKTDLINMKLEDIYFEYCDFENLNFKNVKFSHVDFKNCRFSYCNFDNSRFQETYYSWCSFDNTSFINIKFNKMGINFNQSDIGSISFLKKEI